MGDTYYNTISIFHQIQNQVNLKGEKMKNAVKLFIVALVSVLFVGCGSSESSGCDLPSSDDSSSDGDDIISLSLLKSSSPAFPDNYTLSFVETNKWYSVSYNDERYSPTHFETKTLPNINALARFAHNEVIHLFLDSDIEFEAVADDATYESVFGSIDGIVTNAYIGKTYLEDLSSEFAAYAEQISSTPYNFTCEQDADNGDWYCDKSVGGLSYWWSTRGINIHSHGIYKPVYACIIDGIFIIP